MNTFSAIESITIEFSNYEASKSIRKDPVEMKSPKDLINEYFVLMVRMQVTTFLIPYLSL